MRTLFVSALQVSLSECVFPRTLLFCRLITSSKMKTGLIAFHLAYFQILSVNVFSAVVFQIQFFVLQTLPNAL